MVLLGGTMLTIPLAAASYYLVERPLMKLKYRSLRQVLRGRAQRHGAGGRPGGSA